MSDLIKEVIDNYKTKQEELLKEEENINKRAFAHARKIVRKKLAEQLGEDYDTLQPLAKAEIDSSLKNKTALIKKIAAHIIPKLKQTHKKRLNAFVNGSPMFNQGQEEYGQVKENLNLLFNEKFQKDDEKVKPVIKSTKPKEDEETPKGKIKNPAIKYHEKFSEGVESVNNIVLFFEGYMNGDMDTPQFDALLRLGLVPENEISLYRRALRNPEAAVMDGNMRIKLITLMRKIVDLTMNDSTTYNRLRGKVQEADEQVYNSLLKKSNKSGIDIDIISEVYSRGCEAWSEDDKLSMQQYAFARVNSYINQGKTYFNEDADLNELSQETKDKYLDKALEVHGHAAFAKRHSPTQKDKDYYADVERKRRAGIKKAVKEANGEWTDPYALPEDEKELVKTRQAAYKMIRYVKPDGTAGWRKFRDMSDLAK